MPDRCQAIRVICCELARISSHLLGVGVYGMDAGSWTVFMYTFTEREKLYTLFEELTGLDLQQVIRVLVVLHVISLTDGWVVSIASVKVLFRF